ncbi:hypothetical protein, partial [Pseudomonas sp. FSL R10-0399]|uniref:hypothetical protein n=1 Tax=Pseudomonas sp. FSL R10-0399 TaxID=2662194 RepID=UPI001C49A2F6
CESLDSTGGWLSASRFKRCAYSMNSGVIFLTGLMMYVIAAISFYHVKNDKLDAITRAITSTSTMTSQNFDVIRKYPSCTSIENNASGDGSSVAAD